MRWKLRSMGEITTMVCDQEIDFNGRKILIALMIRFLEHIRDVCGRC